jgi:hypothetical protein
MLLQTQTRYAGLCNVCLNYNLTVNVTVTLFQNVVGLVKNMFLLLYIL